MYIIYDGWKILLCDKHFKNIQAYNYEKKNILDACSIDDSVYVSTIKEIIKLDKQSFGKQKSIEPQSKARKIITILGDHILAGEDVDS